MLLDEVVPTYDVSSRHTIWVAASPAHVYEAARTVDLGRPWLVRVLMGLRAVPAWLVTRAHGSQRAPECSRSFRAVGAAMFTVVAESPGEELVLGVTGRFWTPTGGLVAASADRFHHPPPPGLAQGVWNLYVRPSGTGTELSTETRVRCGDAATRRQFERYWRIIRMGSGLIRGSMLQHIRSTAERRAAKSGPMTPRVAEFPKEHG